MHAHGTGSRPGEVTVAIAGKLLADEIKKLPAPEENKNVDAKSFAAFAGRFDYQGAIMTVTVEGDALFAQLTGQPKHRIFPSSANEFFWKVTDAQVTFIRNEKGKSLRRATRKVVIRLLHRGSRTMLSA
jgi:hypothetical protein